MNTGFRVVGGKTKDLEIKMDVQLDGGGLGGHCQWVITRGGGKSGG